MSQEEKTVTFKKDETYTGKGPHSVPDGFTIVIEDGATVTIEDETTEESLKRVGWTGKVTRKKQTPERTPEREELDELDVLLQSILARESKLSNLEIWRHLKRELERKTRKYDAKNILIKYAPSPKPHGALFWAKGLAQRETPLKYRTLKNRLAKARKKTVTE